MPSLGSFTQKIDLRVLPRVGEVYEEKTRLVLVMEKLNGPDLFDAFSKRSHGLPLHNASHIVCQGDATQRQTQWTS